ncbi:UreD urease accessory protein-domain-containing protein, partial [Dimargaris cristalligena]
MIPLQEPGQGHIHCGLVAGQPTLFQCSGKYPLKLVAPRTIASSAAAAVYILTYGGGIVHGDRINLSVQVDPGAVLTLLTQGSTKVFRNRDGEALQPEVPPELSYSLNQLTATVAPGGCLVCLPSPVTCFKESRYLQNQRIELQDATSGLVLLDWMTSGRHSCGESWQFDLYNSTNTIYLGG